MLFVPSPLVAVEFGEAVASLEASPLRTCDARDKRDVRSGLPRWCGEDRHRNGPIDGWGGPVVGDPTRAANKAWIEMSAEVLIGDMDADATT